LRREFSDPHANLPAVVRLYRIPTHDDADTPAIELMNIILGQGESSRLNVTIVRHEKAALFAGSGIASSRRGPGTTYAFGVANQGVAIDRLDSLLAAQIDTIRASGISADELAKAKATFRARFIETRETVLNKAEELQHYAMFHANLEDINTDLDKVLAVTNDDIRRVATRYLDPANSVILIVRPAAPAEGGGQ
jgi:predicted Zn-dependent peptidase